MKMALITQKNTERLVVKALKQAEKDGGRGEFGKVAKLHVEKRLEIGKVRTKLFIVPKNPKPGNERIRSGMVALLRRESRESPQFLREGEELPGIKDIERLYDAEKPARSQETCVVAVPYVRMLGQLDEIKIIKKNRDVGEVDIFRAGVPLIENHYYKSIRTTVAALIATGGILFVPYAAIRFFPNLLGIAKSTTEFLAANVDSYVVPAAGALVISSILYGNYIGRHTNKRIHDLRSTLSDIVSEYARKKL